MWSGVGVGLGVGVGVVRVWVRVVAEWRVGGSGARGVGMGRGLGRLVDPWVGIPCACSCVGK